MNHGKILNDVCIGLGITKPDTYADALTETEYDRVFIAIEDAEVEIFQEKFFKFRERSTTFNTVIGQRGYANSYGLIKTDGLFMADIQFDPLPYYSNTDLQDFITDTSTGKPDRWTIFNNEILFYSIPDAIYAVTILYETKNCSRTGAYPSTGTEKFYMSAETDEPNYPETYHKLVVFKALMNLYDGQQDKYTLYKTKYDKMLKQMYRESTLAQEGGLKFSLYPTRSSRLESATRAFERSGIRS